MSENDVLDLLGTAPGDAVYDDMVDLRRAIHRRPELAFAEHHTTALVRERMAGLGIEEAMPRVTETGGIFVMEGGLPGRSVVLRGDIDALPVQEDMTRAGHSEVEGVMHACGHDVHVAALLGAASALSSRREELPGRYVFVFQPAEEALCGAKTMVENGALSFMEGSRLIGFHVTSVIPTGLVALRDGITLSEAHSLTIALTGPGGHGAIPSEGDVIRAAAELVGRLGSVVEGLSYEASNCVCSAGTLRAGTAVNVVPTSAKVTGTLRTFTNRQRESAVARLRDLCASVASDRGVTVELELPEHTPAVVNDASVTALVEAEAAVILGSDAVFRMPPTAPSDDVSEFLNHLPGCYFFVGGAAPDGSSGVHHCPTFSVEDGSLRVGASVMVRSAVALAAP